MFGRRRVMSFAIVVTTVCATVLSAQTAKLTTTWAASDVGPMSYAGRKVAAIAITSDMSLRMSAEEAMAREITARGPQGIASYRAIPKEELADKARAQEWFARTGVAAAVTIRVVNVDQSVDLPSVTFGASYYQNFSSYYDYGVATIVPIGSPKQTTTLAVETLLYDIAGGGKLLWAGMSETTDPKDVGTFMKGLAKAVGNDLEKKGLIRKK